MDVLDALKELFPESDRWSSETTWWLFKEESGFDDIRTRAGDSLDEMFEGFQIFPVLIDDKEMLYLARFEFPKDGEDFQFNEAVLKVGVAAWADFLAGFPMESTELLTLVGQYTSKADKKAGKLDVLAAEDGDAAPPLPNDFFAGYEERKIPLNYLYLDGDCAQTMADDLLGEPKPEGLHWWVRANFAKTDKFPLPGEFLGLACRLMPDKAWGTQKSSPFLYSGNWFDTLYYTSGRITAVDPPNDNRPYPLYTVRWRKHDIQVAGTDFNEYQVADLVTLIKDLPTEKTSQLWKDDDVKQPGENWCVAPIIFYDAEIYSREEG